MSNKLTFGKELKKRWAASGFTQVEIEQKTGIPQPTFSAYTCGRRLPSRQHLDKIAQVLDWNLQEALHAAGLHDPNIQGSADSRVVELARRIDSRFAGLQEEERDTAILLLSNFADMLASYPVRKSTHNVSLCAGFSYSPDKLLYQPLLTS